MTTAQCDCGTADPTDHDASCVIWRQGRDLVAELREVSRREAVFGNVFALAADEIIALRSRLDQMSGHREQAYKELAEVSAENGTLRSRLDAIMAAVRDWKAGVCSATEAMARICSDRVVERQPRLTGQAPGTIASAHVHNYQPSGLVHGEMVCACGNYYVV